MPMPFARASARWRRGAGCGAEVRSGTRDARVVLDVAHNADGWAAAFAGLDVPPGGRLYALVGLMSDKDADALARVLAASGATAIPIGLPGDRALDVATLRHRLRAHGVEGLEVADVRAGLAAFAERARPGDRMVVTGSHQTVAAVLGA